METQKELSARHHLVKEGESHCIFRIDFPLTSDCDDAQSGSPRTVAVKVCRPGRGINVTRLNNEYNILTRRLSSCTGTRAALRREKEFDTADGHGPRPAVFLEWIEGETLQSWLSDSKHTGDDEERDFVKVLMESVRVAHGLANALASIHENGVRHNDVTAVNVIVSLDADIPVRVIDLGFAELSNSLEFDDCGERVNEDMHALSGLLTEIFSRQELWDANTNISSIVEDKTFSRKFIENKSSFVKNTPPLLISGICLNSS